MTPKQRVKELLITPLHADVKTIAALERKLNISNGTINKWDKVAPSSALAEQVANYFGVSVDYILGKADTPASLPKDSELDLDKALAEKGLVMKFNGKELSDKAKKGLLNVLEMWEEE